MYIERSSPVVHLLKKLVNYLTGKLLLSALSVRACKKVWNGVWVSYPVGILILIHNAIRLFALNDAIRTERKSKHRLKATRARQGGAHVGEITGG